LDIISASPTVAAKYAERGCHRRVLLVGEGDFSFTLALLRATGDVAMSTTATSYDAREDVVRRYRGEANLTTLSRDYGDHVRVLHGVDATDLTTAIGSSEKFDRVVFNFPHIAGKAKMDRNRALLGGYLKSARDVLSERGVIEVALAPGQGGTAMDGGRTARVRELLAVLHARGEEWVFARRRDAIRRRRLAHARIRKPRTLAVARRRERVPHGQRRRARVRAGGKSSTGGVVRALRTVYQGRVGLGGRTGGGRGGGGARRIRASVGGCRRPNLARGFD
jgi:hypothetical protein